MMPVQPDMGFRGFNKSRSFGGGCCFSGFNRSRPSPNTRKIGNAIVPFPASPFTLSTSLPSAICAELRKASSCEGIESGVGGIAGPLLGLLLGVADTVGIGKHERSFVEVVLRHELRRLVMSARQVERSEPTKSLQKHAKIDAFEVLLAWCATSIVPTYAVGVHLALGDADEVSRQRAVELVWTFRLRCLRANIDPNKIAPVLASIASAVCHSKCIKSALREVVSKTRDVRPRSASHVPESEVGDADSGRVGRRISDPLPTVHEVEREVPMND
eukprot:TRINITY_DN14077_c0_g1_i1.p1 TRINITY_DN14077_c0_g1~~TRINITY_DN14077_c0_g1_i1.p1  ORF type:complete len:303 (-),score=43.83 TRINITY_DN14077_c0_g1_i1:82-900(-)